MSSENSALGPNLLQPSRVEPLPLPSHQDRALPRISPFLGLSAACWPESEDEPPGILHTLPRARQLSARLGSRAAPGVCATRVGKLTTRSPEVSGAQGGEERRTGLATAPPGPGNARKTDTRQNKTRAPQSQDGVQTAAPGPAGGSGTAREAVPFRCIDGQAAGARSGLVQSVSHLVIHYRGDLSGPRAALSPSQAFVIPTWVLVSVGVQSQRLLSGMQTRRIHFQ